MRRYSAPTFTHSAEAEAFLPPLLGHPPPQGVHAGWLFVGARRARTYDALPDIRWQWSRLARRQVNANAR
jgi:hypothetical protein